MVEEKGVENNKKIENEFQELKNKVEAILFAVGKWIDLDEITKLIGDDKRKIRKAANELIEDYKKRETSLKILEQNDVYKLSIKEKYADFMQSIIPNAELTKPEIETLAVIAWKQPVLQSQVIEIRSQSAYAHIANLLDKGFIKREKKGRTYVLETTKKFLEYFDLPSSQELKKELNKIEKKAMQQKIVPLETYVENKEKNKEEKEKVENEPDVKEQNTEKKLGYLEVYDENEVEEENGKENYDEKTNINTDIQKSEEEILKEFKEKFGETEITENDVKHNEEKKDKEKNDEKDNNNNLNNENKEENKENEEREERILAEPLEELLKEKEKKEDDEEKEDINEDYENDE